MAPICLATGQVNTLSPSKKAGSLTGLGAQGCHHALNSALGAVITSWGACPCLPSCMLPPPRGCVLQGQPSLRAEPLGTNAPHVPWDTMSLCPLSPSRVVPGKGALLLASSNLGFFSFWGGRWPPPLSSYTVSLGATLVTNRGIPSCGGGHPPHYPSAASPKAATSAREGPPCQP